MDTARLNKHIFWFTFSVAKVFELLITLLNFESNFFYRILLQFSRSLESSSLQSL